MAYLVTQAFLNAMVNDIFTQMNADPEWYQNVQDEDIKIHIDTIKDNPGYFEEIVNLTYEEKSQAFSEKYFEGLTWDPSVGDYFTTEEHNLELFKIVDNRNAREWGYRLISGGTLTNGVQYEPHKNFTDGRLLVTFPTSGSGSGSGSASGNA